MAAALGLFLWPRSNEVLKMKCSNKPGCRCDGCKAFNDTLQRSVQQLGAKLPIKLKKRASRPKHEIFQGLASQVTPPKQPKSCAGQLSLLDFIGG